MRRPRFKHPPHPPPLSLCFKSEKIIVLERLMLTLIYRRDSKHIGGNAMQVILMLRQVGHSTLTQFFQWLPFSTYFSNKSHSQHIFQLVTTLLAVFQIFSSLTLTLSALQTQTRAFSVNCNFSPFSKSSCRELRHNSIFPTLPFLHLHTGLRRNFFTCSKNCIANLFAMGRFLWISAKVFSGKMALFLSLRISSQKWSVLTHTHRLLTLSTFHQCWTFGPVYMYMLKHAKVVAERLWKV